MNIKSQSKKSNYHSTSTRQARRKPGRLLYRQGITADELDRLIEEIGPDRMLAAVDRYTRPEVPLGMAEGGGA